MNRGSEFVGRKIGSVKALLHRWCSSLVAPTAKEPSRRRPRRYSLSFECLEQREVPAVLIVNSLLDSTAAGTALTLREAVLLVDGTLGRSLTSGEQAQISGTLGNNDTIQFSLPSGPQTIPLSGGALDITAPLTITGPGASNLTINGNNLDRVFLVGQIWSPNPSQVVSLSGLTISGGDQVYGGGILNFGTLTVSNCVLSGNTGGSSGGGAIYNVTSLTVNNSTFNGDTVSQNSDGGGIYNISSGTASLIGCTFSANTATGSGSSASSGAAIANSGTMQISNCSFSGNSATSNGGGIYNNGSLTVTSSIFSGNVAASGGGAIDHEGGSLQMTNCTVYGNAATSDGGGINCQGTAPVLDNTIVAGNFQGVSPSTTANDITGSVATASAFNLIGTGGSGGLTNGVNNNQVGMSNLGLGTLANNGGPTQTIALLPGSPAIDKGSNSFVTAGETDQRGFSRVVNGTVDIGSFEVQVTSTAPSNQTATQGAVGTFSLGSFADANATAGPWSVNVNWGDGTNSSTFIVSSQGSLGTLTHTYVPAGTFTVAVTVTDSNSDSSQGSFQATASAGPGVITVNSLADTTTPGSALTLREAILLVDGTLGRALTTAEQAQITGTVGNNTVIQFNLPAGSQTITLTGGALPITAPVTINGPGAANLTINGNNADRVFVVGQIFTQNLSQVDSINGLTISGGNQTYGAGLLNFGTLSMGNCVISNNAGGTTGGGGIYNVGALTLTNCTFSANSVTTKSNGGGLENLGGSSVTATNCNFINNVAGGTGSSASQGGGIANSGVMTLSNCNFSGNSAGSDAGAAYNDGTLTAVSCSFTNNTSGGDGGALHCTGTVSLTYCNISSNFASSSGGAMEESVGTKLTIIDSTMANNSAGDFAGALVNFGPAVTLINVTITGNRAGSGFNGHFGGGISNQTATPQVTLENCIVAGNFQGTGSTPNDVDGNLISTSSYNLIGTGGAGGLTNGTNHNIVGVASPGLGALASNGGPTQTIALLPGSPAINVGNNAFVTAGQTDQRGFTRTAGGIVDIGAYERQIGVTAPANQTAAQGVAATLKLGSFADANSAASPWSVSVNWGDGSAATTFSTSTQGTLPTQSHAFLQFGTLTVTVTVTDVNHDTAKTTFSVTVSAAVASSLSVTGFPTLTTTGISHAFTVTALASNGVIATNYRGAVHFTSSDPTATLPADYTFTSADNGIHVFSATLKTVGLQTLTATDKTTSTIKGTEAGIQVNSTAAAVLTVNSVADSTAPGNALTLRDAILIADGTLGRALTAAEQAQINGTLGNNDTIKFSLPSGPQTITLSGGVLDITPSLTITGPGASNLTISGNNLDRVFLVGQIWSPNASQVVSISGLTISGGNQVYGGGILNFGTLTVSNCVFSGNTGGSSGGGAIYNVTSLTVNNSTFSGNSASQLGAGGGINNISSGTATISGSTFSANTATGSGSSASSGAAISNSGTMQVSNCSFTGNSAGANGGGIYNNGSVTVTACSFANNSAGSDGGAIDQDGTATVTSCTFSGNSSASEGGALDNQGGTLTMTNCTIYGNTATSDGGGLTLGAATTLLNCTITANRVTFGSSGVFGAGINCAGTAPVLDNTIVAGNFQGASPSTTANDIAGSVATASANNLIGTGGSGGLTNGTNGNQVGVSNLGLGTLANNGGPTQTVALLPGSPAIDKGSNTYVKAGETDQRGFTRMVNGTVDIGAFEVQTTSTPPANQTATHGVSASLNLGSFADASNATPWTVTINWGDGTANTTLTKTAQGSLGTQAHTYQTSGTYTVLVTVADANGDVTQDIFQILVS
jgi:predicted outer membrane repeat protein